MTEIFVDGIRSIAVANGVVRVEMVQLRRGADPNKLEPQVATTLLLPVAALKEVTAQLSAALGKLSEGARAARPKSAGGVGEVESALEKL